MSESRRVVRDYRKEAVKKDGWMYWMLPDPMMKIEWRRMLYRTQTKTIAAALLRDFRFLVRRFDGAYGTSFFLGIRIGHFHFEIMSWNPEAVQ